MSYLLDTGVLLRLVDGSDVLHALVTASVRALIAQQQPLLIATQNVAEFCNVATRPTGQNGLGLSSADALILLEREIEPLCSIVAEREPVHAVLKRLIATYNVSGKQVHDARLVAVMLAWQVENVLTLNDRDFRRFEPEGITVVTPASLIGTP
jgi:predicted nucleic acid-binding protein